MSDSVMRRTKVATNVDEKLLKAAAKGDLKTVRERIAAGADINAAPKDDAPPLFGAVASGELEVVRELIAVGADVNWVARPQYSALKTSPLCLAIDRGHWEISQELLKTGADLALEPNRGENAAGEAAHQAIKAYGEAQATDEEWLGKRRTKREKEEALLACQRWTQLVREAIAAGVRVRDYWLWEAAKSGYKEIALTLIAAGTNVNAAPHGGTALNGAIEQGHIEIATALIGAGADLKPLSAYEPAPLIFAAAKDRTEIVPALLDAGADINATGRIIIGEFGEETVEEERDAKGKAVSRKTHIANPPVADSSTALLIAVRRGNRALVNLLVERGADLNLGDKQGLTPLGWALRLEHKEIALALSQAGAMEPEFVEGSAAAALVAAARSGDTLKVEQLLSRGANANGPLKDEDGLHLPLVEAARSGHLATVQGLLKAGADVSLTVGEEATGGITPLMVAARNGHIEVLRALLSAGAKVEAKDTGFEEGGETALHYAARGGSTAAIEMLVAAGAKVNAKAKGGGTPLLNAVAKKKTAAVEALLRAGADANAGPSDGSGPLWHAADAHDAGLVRLLLKHGATPMPRGKKTLVFPLAAAASMGSVQVVQLLLDAGAPVNALTAHGMTALMDAALYGHEDVAEMLLIRGADPNLTDHEGFTPLMAAVRSGKPNIVKRLLGAGADVNRTKDSNETALDLARQEGNRTIISLLESAGGKTGKALSKESGEPRRRKPAEKAAEEPEPPDFSEAAKQPAYQAAVSEITGLCGVAAEPLGDIAGGFSFPIARARLEILLKDHHQRLREQGAYLFRHHRDWPGDNEKLGLLPTRDWADVIRAVQTNSANCNLMPSDIIEWLEELSAEHPFELTGGGFDWLEGRFTQPVKNARKLARKMYEFCSDIVDQGVGSVKGLAKELENNGAFFFWWD